MNIEVDILLSKAYYEECGAEWLKYRSKGRKWQRLLGLLLIGWGFCLYAMGDGNLGRLWFIPPLFMLFGAYEIGDFYYTMWKWLRDRIDTRLLGKSVSLVFEQDVIRHTGPFAAGEIKWVGLDQVKETPKGIFLIPENGISIYLPKQVFQSPTQVETILNHAQQKVNGAGAR